MTSRPAASSSRKAPSTATASQSGNTSNSTKSTSPSWTLDQHVAHLRTMLDAAPAAEELQTTWDGYPTGGEAPAISLGLKHYREALDSGRRISSSRTTQEENGSKSLSSAHHHGIPLSIVVRILKASWIADGTWPVAGCDATDQQTSVVLPGSQSKENNVIRIPRSIHPSAELIKGKPLAILSATPEPGPVARPDPTPSQVAQAYRHRGIFVPDPSPTCNSDEEVPAAEAQDQADDSAEE
ncbi:hypothetical protein OC861_005781 [Tilletia horrida]|nr:hypothetical protein OC861_005781 [Tilletia horrida]